MNTYSDNHNHQTPTLVLGATGKTGRRVIERLRARGVATRAGSRSAEPPFDWEDRSTWGPVLEDVRTVYVSYYPDIAIPGAVEKVAAFAEQAAAAGVQRLVLLSGRGEAEAERAEEAVRASGVPEVTIVRSTWFSQNFDEGFFLDQVLAGELALPAGEVPEPFVDADDIADVAVAALMEDGHAGEIYELTGPRLLTFEDTAREISEASGREIRYVRTSLEEYEAMLVEYEVPEDFIWLTKYLFSEVLDGRNASLADGVQSALGREPKDFADYAREVAATGVWNPVAEEESA
jgi:uncharacterized protein YbjT (DUF2867 family)